MDAVSSLSDSASIVSSAEDSTTILKFVSYIGKAISSIIGAGDDIIGLLG